MSFIINREMLACYLDDALDETEISQIERALLRLKQGTYGLCEGCHKRILVARLNALPFSTTCVKCQREMEVYGDLRGLNGDANWEKVSDAERPLEDQHEVDLSDIEIDVSANR